MLSELFRYNVTNVQDHTDGKRVSLEGEALVGLVERDEKQRLDTGAKARAAVAAGFAKEGFFRDLDIDPRVPELNRRVDIIHKEKIGPDRWAYDIVVRRGFVLR